MLRRPAYRSASFYGFISRRDLRNANTDGVAFVQVILGDAGLHNLIFAPGQQRSFRDAVLSGSDNSDDLAVIVPVMGGQAGDAGDNINKKTAKRRFLNLWRAELKESWNTYYAEIMRTALYIRHSGLCELITKIQGQERKNRRKG